MTKHHAPAADTDRGIVYLACPYSHPDPVIREWRFIQANKYAAKLMQAGIMVFSPISHTHPIAVAGDLPKGWDFWERYDRLYLEASRALVGLCLPGWEESKGFMAEVRIMDELRKPVWYLQLYNAENLAMTIRQLGGQV